MAQNVAPVVDRIRIIPRPGDFLDRNVGSSGEVFYNKQTNSLRIYSGLDRGGFEIVTEQNLARNLSNTEVASVKYTVTVDNEGSGNKYVLNGSYAPVLTFVVGYTYLFDQSDDTNVYYPNENGTINNQHPIVFTESDGTTAYDADVIYYLDGIAVTKDRYIERYERADTRQVQITVKSSTPQSLNYICYSHVNMGNTISVVMPGGGGGVAPPQESGASIDVSPTPPTDPEEGSLWFNDLTGNLYVYLTDDTSSQWVQPSYPIPDTPTPAGFSNIALGDSTQFSASQEEDTLTLVDGPGIQISTDGSTKSITISSTIDIPNLVYNNTLTNTLSQYALIETVPTSLEDLSIVDGAAGQILSTDGAGNFSFITLAGGGGGEAYDQTLNTTDDVQFNSVTTANLTTSNLTDSGLGTPVFTSASTITLDAPDGVIVQNGPFRLPSFTTTEKNALAPVNGDMIYDSTLNKAQVYENNAWVNLV